MADGTKERHFEDQVVNDLLLEGYRSVGSRLYDRELCLIGVELIQFIEESQPETYQALKEQYGPRTDETIARSVSRFIARYGILDAFRKGIKDRGQTIRLYFPKPNHDKNPEHWAAYRKNRFCLVHQLYFSKLLPNDSVDTVLFLNGIPVVTSELKNALTGQYYTDAEKQYKEDRKPSEPLFAYKRCLVHFALGTLKASMTTRLAEGKTKFFPYNLGLENPPNRLGFSTDYVWKEVWARDSILELLQYYVHIQVNTEKYYDPTTKSIKEKSSEAMIFPRYHQRRAVKRLLAQLTRDKVGASYLIQHSAGSGKSNTIAWLAHQLSGFYPAKASENRMFDSIVVVTDRRVLDKQLQNNITQFEQVTGVVEAIDEKKSSQDLKNAIEARKTIIITTLQKFSVIVESVQRFPDRNYAVIIDEAHSSQSGDAARDLRKSLSLEQAAKEDADTPTLEDKILDEISRSGRQPNLSFFAFTATPKSKTLELFGTLMNGQKRPFDEYSMEQAIKEGFIMDVLQSYTSFRRYYKLAKRPEVDDKEYETKKTVRLLNSHVDLLDQAIETKSRIMLEHFAAHTQREIEGKARAMVVTKSRLHAVRYKRKFDEVMREMRLPYKALVAFSGTVRDAEVDQDYTEVSMNNLGGRISITDALKLPEYRLLIVANKYQTGFDEPLLHTMFVDKKLGGVSSVQTLSRLNRTMSGKRSTMVLDFVNEPEQIREDFQEYYVASFMDESNQTDPNKLYDMLHEVENRYIVNNDELTRFAEIFYMEATSKEKLQGILGNVRIRFYDLEEGIQNELRKQMQDYVRLYRFLSQLITFKDVDLEKWYLFLSHFLNVIPKDRETLPVEVINEVELANYKVQKAFTTSLVMDSNEGELYGQAVGGSSAIAEDENELLSKILQTLNDAFGGIFNENEKEDFKKLGKELEANQGLMGYFNPSNSKENIKAKFDEVVDDLMLQFVNNKLELYNKLTEDRTNSEIKRIWFNSLYDKTIRGINP